MKNKSHSTRRSVLAWCLFDAGNSAFSTVIVTFVFSVYFARGVYGDETAGSALWSYALAFSAIIIALLGPLCGAIADHYGARKPGLVLFSAVCVAATALLYFIPPERAAVWPALILIIIANTGFELSQV